MERTQPQPQPPTPVADDAHATVPDLLARAALDYTRAQGRRNRQSHQDRVHGNETGGR